MGIYTSAWIAYGIRIPADTDIDLIEEKLKGGQVGYLTAGTYDHDDIYLTTEAKSADLGTVEPILRDTFDVAYDEWDARLLGAADRIGVKPETEPSWVLLADQS